MHTSPVGSNGLQRGAAIILAGLAILAGCRNGGSPPLVSPVVPIATVISPETAAASPQRTRLPVHFQDVTASAGLRWQYENGATGRHLFPETTGGGVAFLDYNNDGLLDIFVAQGGPVPGATSAERKFSAKNALYRNNGDGTFTDVTAGSGLDAYTGYGQGVSVADYDNDGWSDIYITAVGGNHLFHNNGNGTFTDVTAKAGVGDTAGKETPWPLSAAWGDYDNDGRLDLFVCHYVRWSPQTNRDCRGANGKLAYCRPQVYEPTACRLYHNNGDGTFTDVTHKAGLDKLQGKNMGAVWFDYDDDGWQDLYITNDTLPNFLLHNNHNGTFTEKGQTAGAAVGAQGQTMSGMGVAVGDYDGDGRPDIFAVNFSGETKSIYRNLGGGQFEDAVYASNVAATNLQFLGFGMECFDYDLDGWPDLIIGNGHVLDGIETLANGSTYAQSQQLFHNQGNGTFADDLRSLGDLVKPRVTRGLAVGDYDNDGDVDVVMVGQNGPLQLFRNEGGNANHWITFRLEGIASNRDAIGAKVTVTTEKRHLTQWIHGGSSYCSHSDTRLTFGLGEETRLSKVALRWPSGRRQEFGPLAPGRFYLLREGQSPVLDPRLARNRR